MSDISPLWLLLLIPSAAALLYMWAKGWGHIKDEDD